MKESSVELLEKTLQELLQEFLEKVLWENMEESLEEFPKKNFDKSLGRPGGIARGISEEVPGGIVVKII